MTGFAVLEGTDAGVVWRWELRSVNGRGLDLKLRLPQGFEALDTALRPLARRVLARGSVTASLSIAGQRDAESTAPDPEAIRDIIDTLAVLRNTASDAGIPLAPVSGEALVPLALSANAQARQDRHDIDALSAPLSKGFARALDALVDVRKDEGARLSRIIAAQMTQIESLLRDAEGAANEAVLSLRERTMRQVKELMTGENALDPARLEQEIALLATRADIREEIDRLNAHHAATLDLLAADTPVGRKLDFLTQEFNREANTICSKSATERLTRIGLDLKSVIEQLREQAANVE
jgi:uncharacterized protein (TIGR00255 family)